jgi:hypothetical protein
MRYKQQILLSFKYFLVMVFAYYCGGWKSNIYQLQFNENYIFPKVLKWE